MMFGYAMSIGFVLALIGASNDLGLLMLIGVVFVIAALACCIWVLLFGNDDRERTAEVSCKSASRTETTWRRPDLRDRFHKVYVAMIWGLVLGPLVALAEKLPDLNPGGLCRYLDPTKVAELTPQQAKEAVTSCLSQGVDSTAARDADMTLRLIGDKILDQHVKK